MKIMSEKVRSHSNSSFLSCFYENLHPKTPPTSSFRKAEKRSELVQLDTSLTLSDDDVLVHFFKSQKLARLKFGFDHHT